MSREARVHTLVLCLALLVVIPALAVAQELPVSGTPLPAEMMPSGDGRGADGRVFPPLMPPPIMATDLSPIQEMPPTHRQSGDWSRMVFWTYHTIDDNYQLYDHSPRTGYSHKLTDTPQNEVQPALSRDGARIAFASDADGDFDLYVASYDYLTSTVGTPVKITHNTYHEYWPVWSPDGRRLAFYAFPGSQADVFVVNADGTGLGNLTNHEAFDGYPTWSPDGTKIAFSSYRTGGYRIHVMNVDGANVVQLSAQAGSLYPTWSPDGTKIAYSGDHDLNGWLDLMIMDANGGNQALARLAGYPEDLRPRSWSPLGDAFAYTKIHYIQFQGNWYIENTDLYSFELAWGYSDHLSGGGYSFDPSWASIDHLSPVTAVEALPAESPGPFTVRWGGADQGPAGLLLMDVQMQIDGGPWLDWQMDAPIMWQVEVPGIGGTRYAFRSRGRDFAGNVEPWPAQPDAVTVVESRPPVTTMSPLPPYTRAGETIELRWSGYDVGPSGLAGFEANYRRNNGPWTGWLALTGATEATFDPAANGVQPGDRLFFRVRGVDRAQNAGPWPVNIDDTSTAIYSVRVTGQVIDNTGNPVGGAAATSGPAALGPVASDRDGLYSAYVGAPIPALTLTWTKPGYGALPPLARAVELDRTANPVMPPVDNAITNGDFEAAAWDAWQPGGSLPATLVADAHSGARAAGLADPTPLFGEPVELTNTAEAGEYNLSLTLDGDGNAFAAWLAGEYGGAKVLYSATRRADGSWTTPRLMRGGVWRYDVARDPDGKLHLAAAAGTAGLHLWPQAGDGWSAAAEKVPNVAEAYSVKLAAGPGGAVDVVWSDYWKLFHNRRPAGGGWSAAYLVAGVHAQTYQHVQRLALTPDGALHVVWLDSINNLSHRRLSPGGAWGAPVLLVSGSLDHSETGIGVGVDGAGRLHVGWGQQMDYSSEIRYRRLNGTAWGPVETIRQLDNSDADLQGFGVAPGGAVQALVWRDSGLEYARRETDGRTVAEWVAGFFQNAASMTIDAAGAPHVGFVMPGATGAYNVFYTTRSESGEWLDPVNVSRRDRYSYGPALAADPQGNVHALYAIESEAAGTNGYLPDVAYAGPTPAATSGESVLSRTVTVPPGMAHPTLSFVYQSAGALRLMVGGTPETTLPATPAGFRHEWLDLSAYSGQPVTLTFRLARTAGQPATWAIIDDVSLGAAHTDVHVSGESSGLLAGDTVVHTLAVGNRSALAAAGVTLTYALPPQLVFVAADPAPSSTSPLRWNLGTLAPGAEVTIHITTAPAPGALPGQVVSTATLATTDNELELVNNTLAVTTLLERTVLLPVLLRP